MYSPGQAFRKDFLNLSGNLNTDTAHTSADLVPGQLAFVDAKTFAVINVAGASAVTHPLVILAQGSLYVNDKIGKLNGGYRESVKSRPINGRLISRATKFAPVEEKSHVIQIGYNGNLECGCPEFELDKTYWIELEAKGAPVLRAYNRQLYRTFGVYTGCPVEGETLADPKKIFEQFAALIDQDPEISKFIKEVKVVVAGQTSITGATIGVYQASRNDEGNIEALSEVMAAYPTAKLFSREGISSTYELHSASTPSNNVNSTGLTWTKVDEVKLLTKKICLTLPLKTDGSSNLEDVQEFYADDTKFVDDSIVLYNVTTEGTTTTTTTTTSSTTTSTTIAGDTYLGATETIQAEIYSDNEVDLDVEGVEVGKWTMPSSYDGYMWEECACDTEASETDQCVGLRIIAKTTAELTDKFSDCSFDNLDHVEVEPVILKAHFVNKDGEVCDFVSMPVVTIQNPVIAQGLGEFVVRHLIGSAMNSQDFFHSEPRMREIYEYPYLAAVDRNAKYVHYVLEHTIPSRGDFGVFGSDAYQYHIWMEEGKTTNFDTWLTAYLSTAGQGVTLETL